MVIASRTKVKHTQKLIAKFVVSHYPFANFELVFLFCQSFEWGGVNANHNAQLGPQNKTEDDSRLLKNSKGNCDDEGTFCRGQEADIALFLQETRIRKIRKIFEEI